MTSAPPDDEPHSAAARKPAHPLRTIREIRDSLPEDQVRHFDAELAETDMDDLPSMLTRWAKLGNDGFLEFLLSTPFEGLEFGERSYDEQDDSE
ncbi:MULTISPECIES: hypothetical protein [unclassified Streptomyces]|uniref:hypothetical protein n=1 Tax=unclassified Streptomyces TaxID=2593676 RepID=UPI000BB7E9A6|nr:MULTISPECIES: hypothetical protein [unclassified Streptomyces]TXC93665.1 hypothetical protein FS847_31140 [Streptomyces sp. ISID311]SOE11015.1 hypothetical protein SAMN06272775_2029 [Streptomyces sp. 2323.1]